MSRSEDIRGREIENVENGVRRDICHLRGEKNRRRRKGGREYFQSRTQFNTIAEQGCSSFRKKREEDKPRSMVDVAVGTMGSL